VFLVLVNLLNGLAISDISVIQKESKVTSLISRLEAIYRYEQVLMVPWISPALRAFYNFFHCIGHLTLNFHKDTHFLLSNNLNNKTAIFRIEIVSTNWECLDMDVEEAILREAKAIFDRTAENAEQTERMETTEKQMKETVDKLDKLEKLNTKLDTKLDEILQAILAAPPVGGVGAGAGAAGLLHDQPS